MENPASTILTTASNGIGQAVTEEHAKASEAKTGMANGVNDAATAVRRASEDLRSGSLEERTLGVIADSFGEASDAICELNLGSASRWPVRRQE